MAITTNDLLVAGLDGAQVFRGSNTFSPQAVGSFTSLWKQPGSPGTGATPTATLTGEIETSSDVGAYPYSSSGQSYIGAFQAYANNSGTLIMYDRLWATSGLSSTLTSAQTINNTALTRETTGANVEAWYDIYAVMGSGAGTITMSYTDQAGNTGNTSAAHTNVTTAAAFRAFPLTLLAAGDSGVRAIASVTFSLSRTSGTAGLTLRKPIATLPLQQNIATVMDVFDMGMPKIGTDSALEFIWLASSTASTTIWWQFSIIQG
jgi:hypothetical protein